MLELHKAVESKTCPTCELLQMKVDALEEILQFYRDTLDRRQKDEQLGALLSQADISKLTAPKSA